MNIFYWNTQKMSWIVISGLAIMLVASGCAQHSRTHKTTTVTSTQPSDQSTAQGATTSDTVDEQTTTMEEETTTTTRDSSGGIVGGTFNLIGKVLAFPFKMIAGLFEAIF